MAKTLLAVNDVLVYGAQGGQAGANDGNGGLDKGPDGRVGVYPAAVCEGDATNSDNADDACYADAGGWR